MKVKSSSFTVVKAFEQLRIIYLLEIDGQVNGYTKNTSTATDIYLDTNSSPNDGVYNTHSLTLTDSNGVSETQTINNYVGASRKAVTPTFTSVSTTSEVKYAITHVYRYTNWNLDIPLGGNTYLSRNFDPQRLTENSTGEIDTSELVIDNVDKQLISDINIYKAFRNSEVRIITYFVDIALAEPTTSFPADDYLLDVFRVDGTSISRDRTAVMFKISNAIGRKDESIPKKSWYRENCTFEYRDTNCNYTGANVPGPNNEADFCSKSFRGPYGCKYAFTVTGNGERRANQKNFGGAPAIPPRGSVVFAPSSYDITRD